MLNKIVKGLKDTENDALKIIEEAQIEAKEMIENEKNKLVEIKEKIISDSHEKGKLILKNKIDKAHKKAKEIYEISEKEKTLLKKDIKDKFDQAVGIVLDQIVK